MTTTPPLDIKVIYDASSGRRSTAPRALRTTRARSGSAGAILGAASLVAAAVLYYAIWWQVDRQIYLTLMLHTPIEGVSTDGVARLFGLPPEVPPATEPRSAAIAPVPSARAIQTTLGVTAYGWLTLATLSACGVALAGAAAVARGTEFDLRRIGMILGGGVILALAWGVATTWADYGRSYKPEHLRYAMAAPVSVSACLGLILAARARLFLRASGALLILAAVGSVVALWLGHRCDAVDASQVSVSFLLLVFSLHSAWGWVLLFLGPRWVRF